MKTSVRSRGQSIVEIVVAIVIIALVLTGTVVLLVKNLSAQSVKFDQKKATELAQIVIEGMVSQKNNYPLTFWQLTPTTGGTKAGFDGYTYDVAFVQRTGMGGCVAAPANCVDATVVVRWTRDTNK